MPPPPGNNPGDLRELLIDLIIRLRSFLWVHLFESIIDFPRLVLFPHNSKTRSFHNFYKRFLEFIEGRIIHVIM